MPWATSRVGRTVNQTFDVNNDGRVGWFERGLGAVGIGTGLGLGYYGPRALQAGARNFQMPAAVQNPGQYVERGLQRIGSLFSRGESTTGSGYTRDAIEAGPPTEPIGRDGLTDSQRTVPLARRGGWANSGNRRTGGAFATPVGPGATSAERRTNMITGGYNGVGGLLSMGAGRAALGQSSLSMRNPTVQNQAR